MYGDPLEHPQKETYWGNVNCNGERSCYDEGKRAAECLTFDYKREHNLDVSCTGAWNDTHHKQASMLLGITYRRMLMSQRIACGVSSVIELVTASSEHLRPFMGAAL